MLDLPLFFISFVLMGALAIVLHELGHLCGVVLVKAKWIVLHLNVGLFWLIYHHDRNKLYFKFLPLTRRNNKIGGCVKILHEAFLGLNQWQKTLITVAGPGANLITIVIAAYFQLPNIYLANLAILCMSKSDAKCYGRYCIRNYENG